MGLYIPIAEKSWLTAHEVSKELGEAICRTNDQDCTARFGEALHPADLEQALGFSSGGNGCPQEAQPSAAGEQQPSSPVRTPVDTDVVQEPGARMDSGSAARRQQQRQEQLSRGEHTRQVWEVAYPAGPHQPPEHVLWPPAAPQAPSPVPIPLGAQEMQPEQQQCSSGRGPCSPSPPPPPPPQQQPEPVPPGSLESVRSYVLAAMARQATFLHQVLRTPYQDPTFLEAARQRYFRFLALAATQAPGAPLLVPMYDIDLIWHTHLALSGEYGKDCTALLPPGRALLGHDDTLAEAALRDPFLTTLERYEAGTGLLYNVNPSRRIPLTVAHPLAAALWPVAVVLTDPLAAAPPPTPREVALEFAAAAAASASAAKPGAGARSAAVTGGGAPAGSDASSPLQPHQAMRGSPEHLSQNGVVAVFALWVLVAALSVRSLEGGATQQEDVVGGTVYRKACKGRGTSKGDGAGSQAVRKHRRGLAVARRLLGPCFGTRRPAGPHPGVAVPGWQLLASVCGRGSGSSCCFGQREVEAAVSRMTSALLRLADPADPQSPLASSHHPFWAALLPLPLPLPGDTLAVRHRGALPPASRRDGKTDSGCRFPTLTAAGTTTAAGTAPGSVPISTTTTSDAVSVAAPPKRLPSPPPPLDLPASYLQPPAARNTEGVYLAPHHYASRAPVYYTPSDYCILGRGRWCLPPSLAAELLHTDADQENETSANPAAEEGDEEVLGAGASASAAKPRRPNAASRWRYRCQEGTEEARVAALPDHRMRRINPLGLVVHSPQWRRHVERCYSRLYDEVMAERRRRQHRVTPEAAAVAPVGTAVEVAAAASNVR